MAFRTPRPVETLRIGLPAQPVPVPPSLHGTRLSRALATKPPWLATCAGPRWYSGPTVRQSTEHARGSGITLCPPLRVVECARSRAATAGPAVHGTLPARRLWLFMMGITCTAPAHVLAADSVCVCVCVELDMVEKIPAGVVMRRPVFGAGSWHDETQRASLDSYEAFTSLRFLKDGLGRRVESNKLDKYIINGNEYLDYTGNPLGNKSRPAKDYFPRMDWSSFTKRLDATKLWKRFYRMSKESFLELLDLARDRVFKNLVIILVFVFTYKRIICGLTTALQGQHQVVDAQGRPRRLVHG